MTQNAKRFRAIAVQPGPAELNGETRVYDSVDGHISHDTIENPRQEANTARMKEKYEYLADHPWLAAPRTLGRRSDAPAGRADDAVDRRGGGG